MTKKIIKNEFKTKSNFQILHVDFSFELTAISKLCKYKVLLISILNAKKGQISVLQLTELFGPFLMTARSTLISISDQSYFGVCNP